MKIAILEDEPEYTDLICQALRATGLICTPFQNCNEILKELRRESYDMLILNWHMPDLSGSQILDWVRRKLSKTIPVLFVSSCSGESSLVEILDAGADDYIHNPIQHSELLARVRALLRRAYPHHQATGQIAFNDYLFDTNSGCLTLAGKKIETTSKDFSLALLLFQNMGRALSRSYIIEAIWARDIEIPSRTLDTHICRVRSKLELRPENGYRLAPVYCYGYRLERLNTLPNKSKQITSSPRTR
ncbi:response regulator transcription factor [Collimonas humicola]|uniref:response regulator transcription factor n=1 Tax=Collimonas humicola TaxID=2825886 RepID=UPI001B8B7A7B|nr:response regulator transcription factor [Collimonas humicola]